MAAHSVTILNEMYQDFTCSPDNEDLVKKYLFALDYAPGMDELELDHWLRLKKVLKSGIAGQYIAAGAYFILRIQDRRWIDLGKPSCHEDWMKAKYPEEIE